MATMKAVRMHGYGGPEALVYEDAPRPQAGKGDVLVRVHAAGVNPMDWKIRQGYGKDRMRHKLPLIPGWDVSGVVEEVGADVKRLKKGNEVYGKPDTMRDGAYAEYVAVQEPLLALKPKAADHIHAAGIPLAGMTAWQALFDAGGLSAGQRVLIHAASGGVGHLAVQLAKWKGAYVIGTASAANHDFVRGLGADEVIDYRAVPFEKVVHDVDVVLDTIGGDTQARSWQVLKQGGILVAIVSPPSPDEAATHDVRQAHVVMQPQLAQLQEMAKLVDAGRLTCVVEMVFPLSEARRAHELSQSGHVCGKIVLDVFGH